MSDARLGTRLMPCPFCGGSDLFVLPHRLSVKESLYEVSCKSCGSGNGTHCSLVDAAGHWNQRSGGTEATGDMANALGIAAVVFGMMHKIPDSALRKEVESRAWIISPDTVTISAPDLAEGMS